MVRTAVASSGLALWSREKARRWAALKSRQQISAMFNFHNLQAHRHTTFTSSLLAKLPTNSTLFLCRFTWAANTRPFRSAGGINLASLLRQTLLVESYHVILPDRSCCDCQTASALDEAVKVHTS